MQQTKKGFVRKIAAAVTSVLLCCAIVLTAGGCNAFLDLGEEIDETKTQLYVSNFNGGVGRAWLDEVIERFTEAYKDYEFTAGKTGVQVIVNDNTEMRTDLESTLKGTPTDEVYFAEHAYYAKWAEAGLLLDITDMVQEDLTDYGEDGSIEDKLSAEKISMLTSTHGGDGKYYALPHYEGYQGVIYNAKLFERYGLYFNTEGAIIGEAGGTKSVGPDGIEGTSDDGLPRSVEEFKTLCAYMVGATSVKPFVWTGMYSEYFTNLLNALTTAQLGKERSEVLYNFNENTGENKTLSTVVISSDADGKPTELGTVAIDDTTGYLVWQQSALYYSIDFAHDVISNGWYSSDSVNTSYSHLNAQADFINGSYNSAKEIAMLIDGSWWETEASDSISRSESTYKYDYDEDSEFAWMSLPAYATTAEADAALAAGETDNVTLKDSLSAYAFIYSGISSEKTELAKTFLQFCYTEQSLENFTLATGMTRDVDYDLTDEQVSTLTSYAQSMWNYRKTADVVNTASSCTVFAQNEEELTDNFWRTQAASGTTQDRPYTAFYVSNMSAKEFFEGLARLHSQSAWDAANRTYYDVYDMQQTVTYVSRWTV